MAQHTAQSISDFEEMERTCNSVARPTDSLALGQIRAHFPYFAEGNDIGDGTLRNAIGQESILIEFATMYARGINDSHPNMVKTAVLKGPDICERSEYIKEYYLKLGKVFGAEVFPAGRDEKSANQAIDEMINKAVEAGIVHRKKYGLPPVSVHVAKK